MTVSSFPSSLLISIFWKLLLIIFLCFLSPSEESEELIVLLSLFSLFFLFLPLLLFSFCFSSSLLLLLLGICPLFLIHNLCKEFKYSWSYIPILLFNNQNILFSAEKIFVTIGFTKSCFILFKSKNFSNEINKSSYFFRLNVLKSFGATFIFRVSITVFSFVTLFSFGELNLL